MKKQRTAWGLLTFTVEVIKFIGTIPFKKEYDVLKYQLSKSATSIGAKRR
jgi:hypothetical protein